MQLTSRLFSSTYKSPLYKNLGKNQQELKVPQLFKLFWGKKLVQPKKFNLPDTLTGPWHLNDGVLPQRAVRPMGSAGRVEGKCLVFILLQCVLFLGI